MKGRRLTKRLRVEKETQSSEWVLSKPKGVACEIRDFAWVETNIPCQAACPAGTDIPGYLDAIRHGNYEEAYRINLRDNVFPAVLGRVCTRPCEPACRHGWEGLGEPVAICFSKRSADTYMENQAPVLLDPLFPETGKRVAVVGGGAAGLTVARELVLWGHKVTVLDEHEEAGGLMVQGIPEFRLPREVVRREVEQIRSQGVDLRNGVTVGTDVSLADLLQNHDAVVLSPGTHCPNLLDLPGSGSAGIQHGLGFLLDFNHHRVKRLSGHVVVIGGGFTAVDCARAAQRLGADRVTLYYRRSEQEMYITPGELEEMQAEGIHVETLVAPVAFREEAGVLTGVCFTRVQLGDPDADGRCRPDAIPDSEFEVAADLVLLGTGQDQDVSWVDAMLRDDVVDASGRVNPGRQRPDLVGRLYVAGDFATGAVSLIDAIGHARTCAREIDEALMGEDRLRDIVVIEDAETTGRTRAMDTLPREPMPQLPEANRGVADEVELGLGENASRREAERCYLCHYKFEIDNELCIYCDRCLKVKPVDGCIAKVSELTVDENQRITGYVGSTSSRDYNMLFIDQNECIRCGACVDVCPVECISLQKVEKRTVRPSDVRWL